MRSPLSIKLPSAQIKICRLRLNILLRHDNRSNESISNKFEKVRTNTSRGFLQYEAQS